LTIEAVMGLVGVPIENRLQSSMDSLGHHLSVIEFHHSPDHMKGG